MPPLYVLFYCDYNRQVYLQTGKHSSKFVFRRPSVSDFKDKEKLLLIGSTCDFLEKKENQGKLVKKIDYLNGMAGFLFIENH